MIIKGTFKGTSREPVIGSKDSDDAYRVVVPRSILVFFLPS